MIGTPGRVLHFDAPTAHWAALLLAGAGHAVLCSLLLASGTPGAVKENRDEQANFVTVRTLAEDMTRGMERKRPDMAKQIERRASAQPEAASVPIAQPNGPHYFRMSELTQEPSVVHDAAADLIIRVPGLVPQPVVLRLLISDEGSVDRVLIEDSFLPDEVESEIREAFGRLRFEPGRIGRIPVRSRMRVEVRLETMEYRLPD